MGKHFKIDLNNPRTLVRRSARVVRSLGSVSTWASALAYTTPSMRTGCFMGRNLRVDNWLSSTHSLRHTSLPAKIFSDHAVLVTIAAEVGLDAGRATQMLVSDRYSQEVRRHERYYREQGIYAVRAVVIDDRQLIEGAQPVEVFEGVVREVAAN